MPFESEVIDALPTSGNPDAPILRNFLIKRSVFNIQSTEDPQDFEALDGDTGAIPEVIGWGGTFFWLDPDDTTSAHDGVTVIKTSDDYRYKVETLDYRIRSAISDTVTAQPATPSIGDAYLLPAGVTGAAWSSHQDDIAIFTRNGWKFETPTIGKWLLIEDTDGFKRYTAGGWKYGPGSRSFDSSSIPLSAALGFGERVIVENQITSAPPTATKGLRYIVGPSPTGAWLGKEKDIAICEVDGTWTFYTPTNGWRSYDKSLSKELTFTGVSWVSGVDAFVLLESKVASSSSQIDFTSYLDDTYDAYEIRITSLKPATNNAKFQCLLGTGAGPTYQTSGYRHAASYFNESGAFSGQVSASDTKIPLTYLVGTNLSLGTTAGMSLCGVLRFANPESSDYLKIAFDLDYDQASGAGSGRLVGVGRYDTAGAITGIRFKFDSGNIAAGRFSLYGIRKA